MVQEKSDLVEAFHLHERRRHALRVCVLVIAAGAIMAAIFILAVILTPNC